MYQTSNQSLDKLRLLMAGACVRPLVHDANNLLGAAMAYTELAQMEPGMQAKTARQLGEVVGAITRCSKLLNIYAQLVRPLSYPAPYNLVDAVQHAVDLREYVFRVSGVQVDTVYPETFPNVQGFSAATQYATLALLLDFERGLPGGSGARKLGVNIDRLRPRPAYRQHQRRRPQRTAPGTGHRLRARRNRNAERRTRGPARPKRHHPPPLHRHRRRTEGEPAPGLTARFSSLPGACLGTPTLFLSFPGSCLGTQLVAKLQLRVPGTHRKPRQPDKTGPR
jgi:hypothetical protein